MTTEGFGYLDVGLLTTGLAVIGAFVWWWLRECEVDWAEQIGMTYLKFIRTPEEVKQFLKRNFKPAEAANLREAPRRANVNCVVRELVVAGKLKYGNLTPKPENGFIIRDFMNSTILEWRARAIEEQAKELDKMLADSKRMDARMKNLRNFIDSATGTPDENEEADVPEEPPARDPADEDEYQQMKDVWALLVTTRLSDLPRLSAKATALYFILEEDEEHLVHILSSKVVKRQYGQTA